VFHITDQQEEMSQEFDLAILKSVLMSQHLSSSEQLSFALMWNRVDIARSDIFICQQEWPPGTSFMHDISVIAPNMFLRN
jgi:transient receptor potential cation channel subfamily M protein 3